MLRFRRSHSRLNTSFFFPGYLTKTRSGSVWHNAEKNDSVRLRRRGKISSRFKRYIIIWIKILNSYRLTLSNLLFPFFLYFIFRIHFRGMVEDPSSLQRLVLIARRHKNWQFEKTCPWKHQRTIRSPAGRVVSKNYFGLTRILRIEQCFRMCFTIQ